MRGLQAKLGALAGALLFTTALGARAEDVPSADHTQSDHVFITILALKVRPETQTIKPGDAVGWINYTNRIARVSFAKDVAKKMTCTSKGTFRINGERLESSDIQSQQFASLCSLAAGTYDYKVELFSGAGGSGSGSGSGRAIDGKILVE